MAGVIGVGLYFLPSLVAVARRTHNVTGIFVLNLLLGWTVIFWIVAMIMAIVSTPEYWYCYYPPPPPPPPRPWY
jgi:hypothetical protein